MNFLKVQSKEIKSLVKTKNRPFIIAIAGVDQGAGSTHQSILIANFLRRIGVKTALAECNDSSAFSNLESALGYESKGNNFDFKGIKFFKNVDAYALEDIMQSPFQVVILDIGHKVKLARERFMNADLPLIVFRCNDWKLKSFELFIEDNIDIITKRIKYLALYAKSSEISALKRSYSKDFYSIAFIRDPFVKDKEVEKYIAQLFN